MKNKFKKILNETYNRLNEEYSGSKDVERLATADSREMPEYDQVDSLKPQHSNINLDTSTDHYYDKIRELTILDLLDIFKHSDPEMYESLIDYMDDWQEEISSKHRGEPTDEVEE